MTQESHVSEITKGTNFEKLNLFSSLRRLIEPREYETSTVQLEEQEIPSLVTRIENITI